MRVGNCSLLIPEGREIDSGHVQLPHGSVYTIRLGNHWYDRDVDAEIAVDGKALGGFRVGRGGWVTLERTPDDAGRFTFFAADSAEGGAAGAGSVNVDLRGLVTVRFRPGKVIVPVKKLVGHVRPAGFRGGPCGRSAGGWVSDAPEARWSAGEREGKTAGILYSAQATMRGVTAENCSAPLGAAGVTGLTGHSTQHFVTVADLDYDLNVETWIHLRLVATNEPAVRPLVPSPRTNPVPAPVG